MDVNALTRCSLPVRARLNILTRQHAVVSVFLLSALPIWSRIPPPVNASVRLRNARRVKLGALVLAHAKREKMIIDN